MHKVHNSPIVTYCVHSDAEFGQRLKINVHIPFTKISVAPVFRLLQMVKS